MAYVNDQPYLMIPRDVFENIVAFAEIANVDVYAVLFNSVHQHLRTVSADWPDERKMQFSKRLAHMRALRKGVVDADDG